MRTLKDRLKDLDKKDIQKKWDRLDSKDGLSTKEKLEKLVQLSLKRKEQPQPASRKKAASSEPYICKDYYYPLTGRYGKVRLAEWDEVKSDSLVVIAGREEFQDVAPRQLLFLDTETTGLAGGTGTIPFMLGFGFFADDLFQVKVFILKDLDREGLFLEAVDAFLASRSFSALVTFNGKAFDMPLLETRYILYHRRCPLLGLPHLDFLFPARTLWKNTYDSRKLGYLGEILLGISRSEDIDPSTIPALYFSFLRSESFALLECVVEHNALDIVGLAAMLLLAVRYVEDESLPADEGEMLGLAILYEKAGWLEEAGRYYRQAKEMARRDDVFAQSVKRLSLLLKRQKLYEEALGLWQILCQQREHSAFRELSIHYEHRERNYAQALEVVEKALADLELSDRLRQDLEKRLHRLRRKLEKLDSDAEGAET